MYLKPRPKVTAHKIESGPYLM